MVPRLRPMNCGIGDYAFGLAEEWRGKNKDCVSFIVTDPGWRPQEESNGAIFHLTVRNQHSLANLWHQVGADHLLLHYSGYGYARRGVPVWLVRALQQLREVRPNVKVATMFHELFAFGPPSTSAFWLSPFQRWVAAHVARLSDVALTNRKASATWLERHAPRHRGAIRVLPVFSNLGEVEDAPPPSQRDNHLVFFGYQAKLWDADLIGLRRVLQGLKPDRVTLLGHAANFPANAFGSVPVECTGWLAAESVSAVLCTARYGLMAYHPEYLGKSGILAAYLAHGVVPIFAQGDKSLSEGLERGKHLLAAADLEKPVSLEQLDAISAAGREWYRPHDRHHTALAFAAHLDRWFHT